MPKHKIANSSSKKYFAYERTFEKNLKPKEKNTLWE